ncbi:MAG: heavy metal translocating P-type ATPase [Rickettsiales bacterium]
MENAAISESQTHRGQMTSYGALAKLEADGHYHLTFHIKGVHCGSCIQLIENALSKQPDIIHARVNMSTERLEMVWDGNAERADALAEMVTTLGYQLTPFDQTTEKTPALSQEKFLLRCIAVAGFAAGNLMMISIGLWSTDGQTMGMATRELFHWVSALITLPTIMYAGQPFFRSAFTVLKQGHTNMDVPISLAVILACAMSLLETISHGEHVYFDSAAMLLFFLLIGRYLDVRAKGKARQSAQNLLSLLHSTATIIVDGKQVVIPLRDVREGMVALVAVGDNIPADGVVKDGTSELDMSLITGETMPEQVASGDHVFAGTTNLSAPLYITIAKASDESLLSDIVKLMEKAEQGRAHYVRLAEKAARLYTPVVHTLGLITFLGWWMGMGMTWQPSLLIAITVLIITCPCALGLAVPVVQVLASTRLMNKGILLKSGDALEKLAAIDTVIFDKTGTLTLGKPQLLSGDKIANKDMQLAASLARHSKHPLSQSLAQSFTGAHVAIDDVQEIPGKGLQGRYEGKTIRLGSRAWCGNANATQQKMLELWLAIEGEEPVSFTFSDQLREDASDVVGALQRAGLRTLLLSGDRNVVVEDAAAEVGITEYRSQLSPTEKCDIVAQLKEQGATILMVGDGLNDAPSLASADVSMSPSTAIDIAQNTADIVFQGKQLLPVLFGWETAQRAGSLVKQNFALAVMYNIIAIPLAVMGYVTPMIAAIAMSGSSLIVIANSFRLGQIHK